MSTFDSTKQSLPNILYEIIEGKLQLPDFQRGWVWDDNHIRSLLVSIGRSFPIGAVMLLETGGDVRFQTRPIENVRFVGATPAPERLILDGQQRLTSLTQVLKLDMAVNTTNEKKKKIRRFYYLDIRAALEDETLENAFVTVDEDRTVKTNFGRDIVLDLRSPELECTQLYFPCNQILNSDAWEESLQEYASHHFSLYMKFRKRVLKSFRTYQLPIIVLNKESTKEAVCLVFEKVNTGGVPLSVFELITATYAADGFNLRDDWFGNQEGQIEGRLNQLHVEPILRSMDSTDFLQAITLLQTLERREQDIANGKTGKAVSAVSAKRAAVLILPLDDYKKWADGVEQGLLQVAKFLRRECFVRVRELPYRTQLAPLAAVFTRIGEQWREPKISQKIARWYWCGVLGELYGGAVETRMANDVEELLRWFDDDEKIPRTVSDASFQPERLHTLRSRLSAAYKGLNTLILKQGAKDLFWNFSIREMDMEEIALDIHHIFPKKWCRKHGISRSDYDAIINKTPISYKANRMIGGRAPSIYLAKLQNHKQVQLSNEAMDALLRTHGIDPDAVRSDDFERFYEARKVDLLRFIESAMGKTIQAPSTGTL